MSRVVSPQAAIQQPQTREVVLSVRNLTIDAVSGKAVKNLVTDVSFDVYENELLGLVGESGSGKSITMLAVLGLLAPGLRISGGTIELRGRELTNMSFNDMRKVRGKTASIIFQDPLTTLNPVLRIGAQIAEAVQLHNPKKTKAEIRARCLELLGLVGIPNPEKRLEQFPHDFSGGMRQRVVIAIAMANEPDLLIADEPTTALDVTIQAQVMDVLAEIRTRTGAAMVLITHDLGLVTEYADRLAVMYSGRIVEEAKAGTLFSDPRHPYTAGLIASLPQIEEKRETLYSIPGFVPDPSNRPSGCAFHPRCAIGASRPDCVNRSPKLNAVHCDHTVACHYQDETLAWLEGQNQRHVEGDVKTAEEFPDGSEPILRVQNLDKTFRIGGSLFKPQELHVLRDINFAIPRGKTLGVVGESGCGKSTLAKVLLRLIDTSSGRVWLNGKPFFDLKGSELRRSRKELQVVFQDPYSSLDPRMTVHEVIAEPMRINGGYSSDRVLELLAHVGLPPEAAKRRSPEFSGGQRQRIAIARALALEPDVLILDEAVSALDVSIQAQVINLLKKLQADMGLTYVFISHDLSVVRHISDEVAVMYLGRIVEHGPVDQVFDHPAHPYTRALISAIPHPGRARDGEAVIKVGELPNPMRPPSGCKFRTRCPREQTRCAEVEPELLPRHESAHLAACHFPIDVK